MIYIIIFIFYVPFDKQEVETKQRKQFKGLFDKKPGEIAEAGTEEKGDQNGGEEQKNAEKEDSDEAHEAVDGAPQRGWFSLFWPTGSRIFSALGLQRCTIL